MRQRLLHGGDFMTASARNWPIPLKNSGVLEALGLLGLRKERAWFDCFPWWTA
jgi:hypothetical protein